MTLKEVTMPQGIKDIDEAVRAGVELPAPVEVPMPAGRTSLWAKMQELSVTHKLEDMKEVIKNSVFIIPYMLMTGVMSQWYAWPNGGKTLMLIYFLREAIKAGRIDPANIIYINADDNYEGLYDKGRIFEELGMTMISPDQSDRQPHEIIQMIVDIARGGEAESKLVVLDTLKKFTDMMNKRSQADLYSALRLFTSQGGTIHFNGHANKHLEEGKLVYEGTSDTKNDIDIQYAIYNLSDRTDPRQEIVFKCEKDRGKVAMEIGFEYRKEANMSYREMLDSVSPLDNRASSRGREEKRIQKLCSEFESVIEFVTVLLSDNETMIESEIVKAHKDKIVETAGEISVRELKRGLEALNGIKWNIRRVKNRNNAKIYSLIDSEADAYRRGRDGE